MFVVVAVSIYKPIPKIVELAEINALAEKPVYKGNADVRPAGSIVVAFVAILKMTSITVVNVERNAQAVIFAQMLIV